MHPAPAREPAEAGPPPDKPKPTLPVRRATGWLDRLDRGLLRLERGVRRNTGELLRGLWILLWLGLAVAAGVTALLLLLDSLGTAARYLEGFYTSGLFERLTGVFYAGVAAAAGIVASSLAAAVASLSGSLGLSALRRDELPRLPSRVHVDHAEAEVLELHGRPGVLLHVHLIPDALRAGERLELLARLRSPEGAYLLSSLPSFRGEAGELRVRQLSAASTRDSEAAFLELPLFLPLRAVVLPGTVGDPGGTVAATAEVLIFSEGIFQDEVDVGVRFPASMTAAVPPALAAETEVEILAEALLTAQAETHCGVCGDTLDGEVVHCAHCETPHHRECWDFLGRCATFACDGTRTAPPDGSPEPEPAELHPLARAELRRRSPIRAVRGEGPGWRVICPRCDDLVLADPAGACGRCGTPMLEDLPVRAVPRTPPGLLENPAVVYPLAAAVVLSPWLLLIGTMVLLPPPVTAGMLAGLGVVALTRAGAFTRAVRAPAEVAGRLMVGVLRDRGPRAFTEDLEIRSVTAEPGALFEGSGTSIRVRYLSRDLARHRVETVLRLRTPEGHYLEPPPSHRDTPDLRGLYGEVRMRHLADPGITDRPSCHEVRFVLPEPPCSLPRGVREATLVAEVLCAVDGQVLAEMDHAFAYQPRPGAFAEQAREVSVGSADRLVDARREHPDAAGRGRCACCADPLEAYFLTCDACGHRSHHECWAFLEQCRSCGGRVSQAAAGGRA